MVITGRVPLLLLLGLVPVVLRPQGSTVRLWLLVVAVLVVADLLLAPAVKALAVSRRAIGTVRMGYDTESMLFVENAGRRRLRQTASDRKSTRLNSSH